MQYRKKPVVITAIQLTLSSIELVNEFLGITGKGSFNDCGYGIDPETGSFKITTPEGVMVANIGDWIIKGVNGEFYPCKPDIFEKTYVSVESENCDCGKATPPTSNFDFGQALQFLKAGKKVARAGWNGKGQWVCYMPSFVVEQPNERTKAHGINDAFKCGGYCVLWNTQSVWQPGWVPSQGDLLANDWQVVE